MTWVFSLGLLLCGIGVYFLVRQFFPDEQESHTLERLGEEEKKKSASLIFRLCTPFISLMIPGVKKIKRLDNYRKVKKRELQTANLTEMLEVDEFISFKIVLAIILPLVASSYNLLFNLGYSLVIIVLFALLGYFYPNLWLRSHIKERHQQIRLALPFVVDLLTLSIEAGLDFMNAIARVVEKAKRSPLIEELELVLKEIKLGSTRADALRNLAWRVNLLEISSFVAILVTADQMGASIGDVLRAQADQLRSERFVRAERAGAAASQKMLFPLIFFILPAIFIMIFGPILIKLFMGGFK